MVVGVSSKTVLGPETELVGASLMYAGYSQGQLLYSIHRLTEYFILSDLI